MNGDELYDLVVRYHELGIHRAGTAIDRATTAWYTAELEARGLTVRAEPVAFDRYVTSSTLFADGEEVDHLPLFYEWTGSIDTTDVEIELASPAHAGGRDGALAEFTSGSRTASALVIATEHPDGSLIAVNRQTHPHGGRPTVLVAGRDHEQLATARAVRLQLEAATEAATTTNLEAGNGLDGAPLLLTTPLTGWFGCAGERGCGIAVMLDLIDRFADRPLLVLATGGHELDYLGVRRWVASTGERPAAIIHVGASVAVDEPTAAGPRVLIPSRLAITDVDGDTADRIGEALAPASFIYRSGADSWLGESEVFCELGIPMLSFTGSGPAFHTPEDTASRSTSPEALARVASAIGDATEELWRFTARHSPEPDRT